MKKITLITGVTGQNGSFLVESLLQKGYEVFGMKQRASSLKEMVAEMVAVDLDKAKRFALLKDRGFDVTLIEE